MLAKAFLLDGDFLVKKLEGLPNTLLTIYSGRKTTAIGVLEFHIAVRPKPVPLKEGIYYDDETGAGVAVSTQTGG